LIESKKSLGIIFLLETINSFILKIKDMSLVPLYTSCETLNVEECKKLLNGGCPVDKKAISIILKIMGEGAERSPLMRKRSEEIYTLLIDRYGSEKIYVGAEGPLLLRKREHAKLDCKDCKIL
jgi:hypothetical protein